MTITPPHGRNKTDIKAFPGKGAFFLLMPDDCEDEKQNRIKQLKEEQAQAYKNALGRTRNPSSDSQYREVIRRTGQELQKLNGQGCGPKVPGRENVTAPQKDSRRVEPSERRVSIQQENAAPAMSAGHSYLGDAIPLTDAQLRRQIELQIGPEKFAEIRRDVQAQQRAAGITPEAAAARAEGLRTGRIVAASGGILILLISNPGLWPVIPAVVRAVAR